LIESWTGTVRAPAQWHLIETWTGTIRAPAQWWLIESWTGTARATSTWNLIDSWTTIIKAPSSWKIIENWAGAVKALAHWKLVEAWAIRVGAPGVPSSNVNHITPFWISATPFTITATASDPSSGGYVATIKLWYRYSRDKLSWSSWQNFGDNTGPNSWSFTAPAGDGYYQFYSTAADEEGNTETAPKTADAMCGIDTVPPSILAVAINDDDPSTTSTSVIITVLAVDETSGVVQIQFSDDGSNWTGWEDFSTTKQYVLQPGVGMRTVYVRVRDNAGLISAAASDSIELTSFTIKGVAITINSMPIKPILPIAPELPTASYEFFTMLAMVGGLAAFSIAYSLIRPSRYYFVLKRLKRAVFAKRQRIIGKPATGPIVRVKIGREELTKLKKLQKSYKKKNK
ncbi:MAG: hypothetical protein ACUVQM_00790, partial [Candidatus Hadarchaeaceae archaeon]